MIPELTEYKSGRDVLLMVCDSGDAIFEARDLQDDGMC